MAHNTVSVGGKNSSEVWSGFRVGKRAKVNILKDEASEVTARHNGFKPVVHERGFQISNGTFIVEDCLTSQAEGISIIHFAPSLNVQLNEDMSIIADGVILSIYGAEDVQLTKEKVSKRYNLFEEATTAHIRFKGKMKYVFSIKTSKE